MDSFCIQFLRKTNLVDVGSTKQARAGLWLLLFDSIFDFFEVLKVFSFHLAQFPKYLVLIESGYELYRLC